MEMSTKIIYNEKTYVVKYPNVGQLLEIESIKQSLSSNNYTMMALSNVKSMSFALDIIDSVAYFSTLIPDLKADLNVKNFMDLDQITAKRLTIAYRKYFLPWYGVLEKELMDLEKELSEELKESEDEDKSEE